MADQFAALKNMLEVNLGNKLPSPLLTPEEQAKLEAEKKAKIMSGPATPPVMPEMGMGLSSLSIADMTNPEDRALQSDLRRKFKELVTQQETGIDQQNENLNAMKAMPQGANFQGLAGFADFMNNGKTDLSKTAKELAPMDANERAKMIMQLEGALQDDRHALTAEIGDHLSMGDQMKLQMKIAEMQAKNDRFGRGQMNSLIGKFNTDINKDSKDLMDANAKFNALSDAFTPDAKGEINLAKLYAVLPLAARSLGHTGVLTDTDIGLTLGKSLETLEGQVNQYINAGKATIPMSAIAPLVSTIKNSRSGLSTFTKKKLGMTRDKYEVYGLDPNITRGVVDNIYQQGLFGEEQPQAPAPGSIADILSRKGKP